MLHCKVMAVNPARAVLRKPWLALAAAALCSLHAYAEAPAGAAWRADCRIGEREFALLFEPAAASAQSHVSTPPDMHAKLLLPGRPEVLLPLSLGVFRPRSAVAAQASGCAGLSAYLVQDQVYLVDPPFLLLGISVADRPGWDQLSLVLINLDSGQVLQQSERVAPIKDPDGTAGLQVQLGADHIRFRLQRRWLYHTGTDSPDNSIEGWYRVQIRAERIRGRWES